MFAPRSILWRKGGGTALRDVWALRGQGRMPGSLEAAGKGEMSQGCPTLWRGEGLGFQSLLSISISWASSMDQPLPRPSWREVQACRPPPLPSRRMCTKTEGGDRTVKPTAPAQLKGLGDFLLQLLFFEPKNSLARNKIRMHISV